MPDGGHDLQLIARPRVDPTRDRIILTLPHGLTIRECVMLALPGADAFTLERVEVSIDGEVWRNWDAKPKPGMHIVVNVVPGKSLATILSIVVVIAALALGQWYAPTLAASLFGAGATAAQVTASQALISAVVLTAGQLLISAFVPQQDDKNRKQNTFYTASGWQNNLTPNGPVPMVLGTVRYAPPYITKPYTEVITDYQYVRFAFCLGYGELTWDSASFKIGDDKVSDYDEFEFHELHGLDSDGPMQWVTQQVIEKQYPSVVLTYEQKLNLQGNPEGAFILKPVLRDTPKDIISFSIDIFFPAGLFNTAKKSGNLQGSTVVLRVRYRPSTSTSELDWIEQTFTIVSGKQHPFIRTFNFVPAVRGQYQVECTRMTPDKKEPSRQDDFQWYCLRGVRPEYPINFGVPLAIINGRAKITYQLNGTLNTFSLVLSLVLPDYDVTTDTWIRRVSSNPASLYRYLLQGPVVTYPVTDDQLNLEEIQAWHDFCRLNNLSYNRVHDDEQSQYEVLQAVCAAGRATPQNVHGKWTVVVDNVRNEVKGHITPYNCKGFAGKIDYLKPPDAFLVQFFDETNEYIQGERLIPWPGLTEDDVNVHEDLQLVGVTNPDQIWLAARRRQYELIHRLDSWTADQHLDALNVRRGDLVKLNHFILDDVMVAGRVKTVQSVDADSATVVLDQEVQFTRGQTYVIRFRGSDGASWLDTVGNPGFPVDSDTVARASLTLIKPAYIPEPDDLFMFGEAASETEDCLVHAIQGGKDLWTSLTLIPYAPIIDTLLAADIPPLWSPRVGEIISTTALAPPAPEIIEVQSGASAQLSDGDTSTNQLTIIAALTKSAVPVDIIQIEHKLDTDATWHTAQVASGSGTVTTTIYSVGNTIDIRAKEISVAGVSGPYCTTIVHIFGQNDDLNPVPQNVVAYAYQQLGSSFLSVAVEFDTPTMLLGGFRALDYRVGHRIHNIGGGNPGPWAYQSFDDIAATSSRSQAVVEDVPVGVVLDVEIQSLSPIDATDPKDPSAFSAIVTVDTTDITLAVPSDALIDSNGHPMWDSSSHYLREEV